MPDVFISYAREDTEYAHELWDTLKAKGFDVWIDDMIPESKRWFQMITDAILRSKAVIVIMSPEALDSDWVEKEILLANRYQKPIFPLLLRGEVFPILINIQYTEVSLRRIITPDLIERLWRAVDPNRDIEPVFDELRRVVGEEHEPDINVLITDLQGIIERRRGLEPALIDRLRTVVDQVIVTPVEHEGIVYISHVAEDDVFVDRLVEGLAHYGIKAFVDHRDIDINESWIEKLRVQRAETSQVIAVVSRHSLRSATCLAEWRQLTAADKEIVPVLLHVTDHFFKNADTQTVDFSEGFNEPLRKLTQVLTDEKLSRIGLNDLAQDEEQRLPAQTYLYYPLKRRKDKFIGIATGNIAELTDIDVLVNSENDHLRMDRKLGTVSAALNYAGAKRDQNSDVIEFTIDQELEDARCGLTNPIPATTVVTTSAGALARNRVRHILHVVSVLAVDVESRKFDAVTELQLGICVVNVLMRVDRLNDVLYRYGRPLESVAFPILGTGQGGETVSEVAETLVERAIEYLESKGTETFISTVYFVAYTKRDRLELEKAFGGIEDLAKPITYEDAQVVFRVTQSPVEVE